MSIKFPHFQINLEPDGNIQFVWTDRVDPAITRLIYVKVLRRLLGSPAESHIQSQMVREVDALLHNLIDSRQIYRWPDRWRFTRHADPTNAEPGGLGVGSMVRVRDPIKDAYVGGIFLGWANHIDCFILVDGSPKEVRVDMVERVW